ncbi:O-antigen ligase family protein [Pelotomaculum propionicicum]|uniref:O-antigen ligase family protein n=1 Tax=Pelotomaculum propionicicum TaxID=258475 RepID=UPI003B7E7DF7
MWIRNSKLFYILLVIYYGWFQIVFYQIPNMMLFLGSGMIYFILLHAIQSRINIFKSLTGELKLWIVFAFTSFLFGLMVAVNKVYLINSVATFVQFTILIFGIVYISNQDRKIDFFINVFIIFTLLCAVTTVFWGLDYGQGRITMGINNNPNELGITMVLGVGSILYKLNLKKLGYSIIAFSAILLLVYVCILTGSRKAFISIVLLIIYWLTFIVFKDIRALRLTEKVKGIISLLLIIGFAYFILVPNFNDSVLILRLTNLFEFGDETRQNMYIEAFQFFKQSPLVGIGLNNFRAMSIYQGYSHSTYAETLACTGIVGCILYLSAYILIIFKYGKMVISNWDDFSLKQARIMLGIFGVLLFLGIGIIHFYEMTSSIAFGMIIAYNNINKHRK